MSMSDPFLISTPGRLLNLTIYKGHFATSHSHTNYYIDVTPQKCVLSEAKAAAKAMAPEFKNSAIIDTILCLDGTEVIGACLADELTRPDMYSVNAGNPINVLVPEYTSGSQMYFRDNIVPMVTGKNVLLLDVSVVTGYTVKSAAEAVNYFGGTVVGAAALFAIIDDVAGVPVKSVFDPNDLPGYSSKTSNECPMCRQGMKIDALVNTFGCSKL